MLSMHRHRHQKKTVSHFSQLIAGQPTIRLRLQDHSAKLSSFKSKSRHADKILADVLLHTSTIYHTNLTANQSYSIGGGEQWQDKVIPIGQMFIGMATPLLSNTEYRWHHLHVRGFKTDRSGPSKPDITSNSQHIFVPASNMDILQSKLNKVPSQQGDRDPEVIKSPNEQQIKLAYAEGYLLGTKASSLANNRGIKLIKFFLKISLFATVTILFFGLSQESVAGRFFFDTQDEIDSEEMNVTFNDVMGCDEAKKELQEVVEFLKSPEKFSKLGGKLPKGVLLVGPPGTGKTLLARAVAGEAAVPFFHVNGSEFDEMLVGQGARRVRNLFKSARKKSPCVIFIDEVDSVGSKRSNSALHPYANQTINQLLSEMDGFQPNEGVIVLGATNRRNDLDHALLRPGRFDVEVTVPIPDYTGRLDLIRLYLKRIKHENIDVELLARGTTGFTGADLESMINQSALRAAIDGDCVVNMKQLQNARDKVIMGPERKSRLPDEEANRITAYHEGGHVIVAYFTKESDPIHKVTIMPRGQSLGHTAYIPKKEAYHVTKAKLLAKMDTMMGGRAAEELIFGPDKITLGASSDLKQATTIAHHMIKDWGMGSDKIGLRTFETPSHTFEAVESLSANTSESIDAEIKKSLADSYERAKTILKNHQKELTSLAEELLKHETLDADQIKIILNKTSSH